MCIQRKLYNRGHKAEENLMELLIDGLTNEILFYGGLAIAGGTLFAAFICLSISHIKKIRLDAQLDAEYGKRNKE